MTRAAKFTHCEQPRHGGEIVNPNREVELATLVATWQRVQRAFAPLRALRPAAPETSALIISCHIKM